MRPAQPLAIRYRTFIRIALAINFDKSLNTK